MTAASATALAMASRSPTDLDPGGEQARSWVLDELGKGEYHDSRSLVERLAGWVADRLAELSGTPSSAGVSLPPLVIAVVAVVIAVGIGYLLTRVRVERRERSSPRPVLGDSLVSADRLRSRASTAMAEQRWSDAVLDLTRAVARDADTRTLLTDARSLTAHEIGAQLAVVFPGQVDAVRRSMDLFDAVAYGGYAAVRADAQLLRATDETLRHTRPELSHPTGARPAGPGADDTADHLADDFADTPGPSRESVWTTGGRP